MNSCIRWWGSFRRDGYGQTGVDPWEGKQIAAHRMIWRECFGDVPRGMWVLHKCDRKWCVNPEHLFLGTRQDNIDDMVKKRRHRNGRFPGERNGMAKLQAVNVRAIRRLHRQGRTRHSLAIQYGVSWPTIDRIVKRHAVGGWRTVR